MSVDPARLLLIRVLSAANLAGAALMGLLFAVMVLSRNPDVVIDRALGGHSNLVLGPLLPLLVIGSQAPLVERGVCLLLLVLLIAAGIGIRRREGPAVALEVVRLSVCGASLLCSALILLRFQPAVSILHFLLAVGLLAAGWQLAMARRFAVMSAVVVCTLIAFIAVAAGMLTALSGLR